MKFDLGPIQDRLAPGARSETNRCEHSLRRIEEALKRLDAGRFGYCDRCGEPIAMDRLRADPTVETCQSCMGTSPDTGD